MTIQDTISLINETHANWIARIEKRLASGRIDEAEANRRRGLAQQDTDAKMAQVERIQGCGDQLAIDTFLHYTAPRIHSAEPEQVAADIDRYLGLA